jgi:hypothetical protein
MITVLIKGVTVKTNKPFNTSVQSALLAAGMVLMATLTGCGGGALVKSGVMPKLDTSTSLLGTDADGNGVRDDIDAYIASLPDTAVQKRALRQSAAAINATVAVEPADSAALLRVDKLTSDGVVCLVDSYSDIQLSRKRFAEIQGYTINTKARFLASQAYNRAMSGTSSSLPAKGTACAE